MEHSSSTSWAPLGKCFALRQGRAQGQFQTCALLSPSYSPPGGSQGAEMSLAPQPVPYALWGEDAPPGLMLWSHKDTEPGEGKRLPNITQKIRRAPASQPSIPELLPTSSQAHSLRSLGRALTPGSPPTAGVGYGVHHGSTLPPLRPRQLGEVSCQATVTPTSM